MKNEDILKENGGKKFDVVLMNPPYEKKLHERFLLQTLDITNKLITVQPLTWLTNQKQNKEITQKIDNLYCNIEQIDPNKYFDALFAQDIAIQYIDKDKNQEIIFNDNKYNKCNEISKNSNNKLLMEFKNIILNNIDKSLDDNFKFVPGIPGHPKDKHTEYNPKDNWYIVKGAAIRGHAYKGIDPDFYTLIPKPNTEIFNKYFIGKYKELINLQYKNRNNISYYWAFNTLNEAKNFINYITSDFARACLKLNKTTANIIGGALKYIPWFDFSDEHFSKSPREIDDWLFKKYNISNEIRKHIEEILPDYYGIRKKFDIVLMNPPYANKLHEKFLMKVLDISNKGVSIQPSVWVNKANKNRKSFKTIINKCQGRLKEIEIIDHRTINDLFSTGNSLQDGGIFVWEKHGDLDLNTFGYNNEIERSLFEKTNIDSNNEMMLIRGQGKFRYRDENHKEIKDNECPVYQWHYGKDCYDSIIVPENLWDKKAKLVLIFKDSNEVNNFKESLKTKFTNWFFKNYVIPGDYKILTYMFRMKDYSKPWTDERFYKLFNLTKDEINIIENN